jgi:membrane protein YdbS with pleckstrin-like domain
MSIVIEKGGFFKRKTEIYLSKIYTLEKETNPLLEKFRITNLRILTVGRTFKIKGLSTGDAESLYTIIMRSRNAENF